MSDAAMKAMKWVFLMMFVILGAFGLYATENTQDMRWLGLCVIGFGTVYLFDKLWTNMNNKTMITSGVLMVLLGTVSFQNVAPTWLFYLTDSLFLFQFTFFQVWAMTTLVFGFLIMFIYYWRFE